MIKKTKPENKIAEYINKSDSKKIANDIQNFINVESQNKNNLSKDKHNIKAWYIILIVIGFFVGTIIFISLLSMYLTGFR